MLNAIIATARKDLGLLAKDPGALALLFVMPLAFIVVMSFAMEKVYEPSATALAVVVADEDHGLFGTELVRELRSTGGFEVVTEEQGKALDRPAAELLIAERHQQIAVIVPAGLSEALRGTLTGERAGAREIFLVTDPSLSPEVLSPLRGALNGLAQQAAFRSMSSVGIDQMVQQFAAKGVSVPQDFSRELKRRATQAQAGNSSLVAVKDQMPAGLAVEQRPNSVEQNVPGYTLFGLFFIAIRLAGNIFEERRLGTFRRLLAAPVPRWALMAGKILAFVAINVVQVAILFAVGVWLLPRLGAPAMSLGKHPEGIAVVTLAVALVANSLGLMLAAFARTAEQATGLGLIVVLTSAMIGGVMVPRYVMPPFLQALGLISPHTWGLMAYQDVLMRGAGVAAILPAAAILLGFAAAFFAVGIWRFRWD